MVYGCYMICMLFKFHRLREQFPTPKKDQKSVFQGLAMKLPKSLVIWVENVGKPKHTWPTLLDLGRRQDVS